MDDNGPVQAAGVAKGVGDRGSIVPVDRSEVRDIHLLKEHSGNHQLFQTCLGPADIPDQLVAHIRDLLEILADVLLQSIVGGRRSEILQSPGNTADIAGDRHVVVVQNDDEIAAQA